MGVRYWVIRVLIALVGVFRTPCCVQCCLCCVGPSLACHSMWGYMARFDAGVLCASCGWFGTASVTCLGAMAVLLGLYCLRYACLLCSCELSVVNWGLRSWFHGEV